MLTKKFFKTIDEAEVTFEFAQENVESVSVVGEFNNWTPSPMNFNKKADAFRAKIRLPKGGDFQFRYLLNEEDWQNDSSADAYVGNEFGGNNSVVSTVE